MNDCCYVVWLLTDQLICWLMTHNAWDANVETEDDDCSQQMSTLSGKKQTQQTRVGNAMVKRYKYTLTDSLDTKHRNQSWYQSWCQYPDYNPTAFTVSDRGRPNFVLFCFRCRKMCFFGLLFFGRKRLTYFRCILFFGANMAIKITENSAAGQIYSDRRTFVVVC